MTARVAHHLAIVNSIDGRVNTNDHHAGYYYNLTGHAPDPSFLALLNNRTPQADDWPFMGSVVASRVASRGKLPPAITLPHKPSKAPYTRPGQFAARIGIEHDPVYVSGSFEHPTRFVAPSLSLTAPLTVEHLLDRRRLLGVVDSARRDLDSAERVRSFDALRNRSWSLLTSGATASAFDVSSEPEAVRSRYGSTINGMSLLLARRLVEAGVPFITVFWKENESIAPKCKSAGGWDTHGSNFACLKEDLLPEFDRCYSALIEDLHERRLLDSTTVLVTSEMGRTPKIGDPRSGGVKGAGRDHWTHCLTDLLAGGGIVGGQLYGSSDRRAEYPASKPVTPAHITKTVYHAMGIDDLGFTARDGRTFNLLEEGAPLLELF
jgi:hypothetical protein